MQSAKPGPRRGLPPSRAFDSLVRFAPKVMAANTTSGPAGADRLVFWSGRSSTLHTGILREPMLFAVSPGSWLFHQRSAVFYMYARIHRLVRAKDSSLPSKESMWEPQFAISDKRSQGFVGFEFPPASEGKLIGADIGMNTHNAFM